MDLSSQDTRAAVRNTIGDATASGSSYGEPNQHRNGVTSQVALEYGSTGQQNAYNCFIQWASRNPRDAISQGHVSFAPPSLSGKKSPFGTKALLSESVGFRRGTLNWIPFIVGITLPWILFTISLTLNGFRTQDTAPTWLFMGNLVVVATAFLYIYFHWKNQRPYDVQIVIGSMCFVYLIAGWIMGSLLYWFNMHPFYQLNGMATYHGVNPSRFKKLTMTTSTGVDGEQGISSTNAGEQYQFHLQDSGRKAESKRYQDAGVIYFDTPTVSVDVDRTMSFKDGDTYCVAPIVDTACTTECGFDFWAVGINCCGTDGELAFTCDLQGDVPAAPIRSAVRWVDSGTSRSFFRLAVTEAEGAHNIVAGHPLFFSFYSRGENPQQVVAELARSAYRRMFGYSIASFFLNIFIMGYIAKALVFGPKIARTEG